MKRMSRFPACMEIFYSWAYPPQPLSIMQNPFVHSHPMLQVQKGGRAGSRLPEASSTQSPHPTSLQ